MAYFPESTIITTKDGLHCQVYISDHPNGVIIVKPKYIPTDKIHSSALPYRYIGGTRMNRLNMWINAAALKKYIADFKKAYPGYIYESPSHRNWFFAVPREKIEKVYDPRQGLKELMKMPRKGLDPHLKNVVGLIVFLTRSGVSLKDMGVTYSTLVGQYFSGISDINIVMYGKNNFWRTMKFLEKARHPSLRWKTNAEWIDYHKKRGRALQLAEDEFLFHSRRKYWEGFWNNNLFLVFGVEKEKELSSRWGSEQYEPVGVFKGRGIVASNMNSGVRPGSYELKNGSVVGLKHQTLPLKQIVFYSRNFVAQAKKGELIEAQGMLERVTPRQGKKFYRIVVGYFDSFLSDRRKREYIKTIKNR